MPPPDMENLTVETTPTPLVRGGKIVARLGKEEEGTPWLPTLKMQTAPPPRQRLLKVGLNVFMQDGASGWGVRICMSNYV